MRASRKAIIIVLVIGLGIFGYSQYASASQIGVAITESRLLGDSGDKDAYDLQLEFDNPSLLILSVKETEFTVTADEKRIGDGTLEPFVLPALDKTSVRGTFTVDAGQDSDVENVMISGVTKYDMLFTSVEIPFVYHATDDETRDFIHQN